MRGVLKSFQNGTQIWKVREMGQTQYFYKKLMPLCFVKSKDLNVNKVRCRMEKTKITII